MPIRVSSKRRAARAPSPAAKTGAIPFGLPPAPPDYPQKPAGISLCMIVKNEERFLAQCLRSVADVVDEIIVVDTGSTDGTIEIAKSFGATVIEREWRNDFSWSRNQSIALATKRWIMFIDADEDLMPESKPALMQLKNAPAYRDAVWVRCFNESDDYGGTGAMSHALIRIFPNDERIRFRGLIHEFPTVDNNNDGLKGRMAPISIVHHGYLKDVVKTRNKGDRNYAIVKAATEQDPHDPFHWFNLGSTAFLIKDFDAACAALEEMRRINGAGSRGFVPNGLALLAEVYCDKLGDAIKGEEIARECVALSPHYANAHFQLGKALVAQRRFDEARKAYEAAIDDGKYAHLQFVVDDQVYVWKAHSEIGSTYVIEGKDEKAAEWFARGLHNAPGVEPLQVNLARTLERLERLDEANAQYREAYAAHHDDLTSGDLVNFLLRRGDGLGALEIIEDAYKRVSNEAAVALLFAAAQISTKHGLPWAVSFLEMAAERAPHAAEILNPLEAAYRNAGNTDALAALLETERATEPQTTADFLRRSFQSLSAGDHGAACDMAERGLEIAPGEGHLHYNAALALSHIGRKDDAIFHLARVEAAHAGVYPAAALLRAATEREIGKSDDALATLDRLIDTEPSNMDAFLLRASILESCGDAAGAESTLQRACAADRCRGAIELASFYMRAERFDDAARIATSALEVSAAS
ncbi:MAG: glycosyltransferase [Candidatus Baltobacteraceae bacterium]